MTNWQVKGAIPPDLRQQLLEHERDRWARIARLCQQIAAKPREDRT